MAKTDQKRVLGSLPLLVAVAFITGTVFLSRLPLRSSRPVPPTGLKHQLSEREKVDARLWQDPYRTVMDHERIMHLGEAEFKANDHRQCPAESHDVASLRQRLTALATARQRVHILMVMSRDLPRAEDHERRLRNRYALLMAMRSMGLTPEDAQHVQYFRLNWCTHAEFDDGERQRQPVPRVDEVNTKDVSRGDKELLLVPFEWFRRETLYPRSTQGEPPQRVLVIWLPESAFAHRPLTRLAQLIHAVGGGVEIERRDGRNLISRSCLRSHADLCLIGPSLSGTLKGIIDEIPRLDPNEGTYVQKADACGNDPNVVLVQHTLQDVTIYSPWSTVSPALLAAAPCPDTSTEETTEKRKDDRLQLYETIPKIFAGAGMRFVRMIGTDDLLALQIINELRRRGIDMVPERRGGSGDEGGLMAELDTFYGKAFPLTLGIMAECINPNTGRIDNWLDYVNRLGGAQHDNQRFPENLRIYSYARGVDGILPDKKVPEAREERKTGGEEVSWEYVRSPEQPIGHSQSDYIRRLLHRTTRRGKKPRALGVVGTDVYDKLLLFQAVREELPGTALFTIDVDARLMHRRHFPWTRNVIVASQFGLELSPTYQPGGLFDRERLAPFRDNYQTALYLASCVALGMSAEMPWRPEYAIRKWSLADRIELICQPRLFEIGRECAVDLSVNNAPLHRRRARFSDRWPWPILWYLLATGVLLVLFYQLSKNFRLIVKRSCFCTTRAQWKEWLKNWSQTDNWLKLLIPVTILGLIVFVVVVMHDHYRPTGERFSLARGVSIWPGEIMLFCAGILGIWCLVRLRTRFPRDNADIEAEFFKLPPKSSSGSTTRENEVAPSDKQAEDEVVPSDKQVVATKEWKKYVAKATLRCRMRKSIPYWVLFWILLIILLVLFGRPYIPYRGNLSLVTHAVLGLVAINALLLLLFVTVGAIKECLALISPMIDRETLWKTDQFNDLRNGPKEGPKKGDLAEWLDVRLIAQMTERVGRLLYWPSVITLLMIASRIGYFDNWGFPRFLVIIYAVPGAYIIGCAIGLQLAARRARTAALRRLRERLDDARFGPEKNVKRAAKIELHMDEIMSMRQGAFRPLLESPVVHAILIPSGGLSLLTVLPYLLRA